MIVDEIVITCCWEDCGISFAVPSWWVKGKKETHSAFYCPNGHSQSFKGETELDKMRRARDRAIQEQARIDFERRTEKIRADRAEAVAKRLKKRASAGTCPCCQRTFSNMTRHMKTKHPNFTAEVVKLGKRA